MVYLRPTYAGSAVADAIETDKAQYCQSFALPSRKYVLTGESGVSVDQIVPNGTHFRCLNTDPQLAISRSSVHRYI
jgi:hypothetical protein